MPNKEKAWKSERRKAVNHAKNFLSSPEHTRKPVWLEVEDVRLDSDSVFLVAALRCNWIENVSQLS